MMNPLRRRLGLLPVVAAALLVAAASVSCSSSSNKSTSTGGGDLDAIAKERGLTPEDMKHALQQFVPPGKHDD